MKTQAAPEQEQAKPSSRSSKSSKSPSKMEEGVMEMMERGAFLGRGSDLSIRIPVELAREFERDLRVVIRYPWIIGIPIPERLLQQDVFKNVMNEFEAVLVPRGLR